MYDFPQLGWFAHPIYTSYGDYPPIMKRLIDNSSQDEGRKRSRLPSFTQEEIQSLKGSFRYL